MSEKNKEIQVLNDAMKGAKGTRMFKRYQTISLKLTGEKIADIAKTVGISKRTVDNYWAAYRKGGLEGLIPKKQPGAIKKLTEEQEAELLKVIIDKTPRDVGFKAAKNWTAEIVRDHIQNKYDVEYTTNGVSKLLHRLGLSYTWPTYTLKKTD